MSDTMTKKQTIEDENIPRRVKKDTATLYDFPCITDIVSLVNYLNDAMAKYGHDAQIEIVRDVDDYWGSATTEVHITTFRDETPQEIEKRIAKAKKDAERAVVRRVEAKLKEAKKKEKEEAEELKLFQKLSKKYQGYNIENIT